MDKAEPARAQAGVERSRWPGWIWAVPIAALGVIGWLGFRALATQGTAISIRFAEVHGLSRQGAKIEYRGLSVGHVDSVTLAKDEGSVTVKATIDQDAAALLRQGTRFWLKGTHPSLSDLSSLSSVLSGPTIELDPGELDPGKGAAATSFAGLEHQPIAPAADRTGASYTLNFEGAVGDLQPGDAVKLRGFTVGEVTQTEFGFDAGTGAVSTPVTLALYPPLFHVEGGTPPDSPAALKTLVGTLVQHGLRAKLERDPPVIGSEHVVLEMEGGAGAPQQSEEGRIPVASSGGGIGQVMAQVGSLPIGQIGRRVLDITRQVDGLVASPALHDAVHQVDDATRQAQDAMSQAKHAVREVDEMVSSARPKVTRLVEQLNRTADELDRTASSAGRVVSGTTEQYGLETTMREVTEAARSLRSLASYLDRHPESLIQGRPGG